MEKAFFKINAGLDRPALVRRFVKRSWIQIRDLLTPEIAHEIRFIIQATRWDVAYVPPCAPVGRYAITGWSRDRCTI